MRKVDESYFDILKMYLGDDEKLLRERTNIKMVSTINNLLKKTEYKINCPWCGYHDIIKFYHGEALIQEKTILCKKCSNAYKWSLIFDKNGYKIIVAKIDGTINTVLDKETIAHTVIQSLDDTEFECMLKYGFYSNDSEEDIAYYKQIREEYKRTTEGKDKEENND